MIDYECMYRALVRRLVEVAGLDGYDPHRLGEYDRVARAHEPNIKEEANVS